MNSPKSSLAAQLRFDLTTSEIDTTGEAEKKRILNLIDSIAQTPVEKVSFENTVIRLERGLAEFSNHMTSVMFLKYISSNKEIRASADSLETSVSQMFVDIFIREDLYKVIRTVKDHAGNLSALDQKLLDEYLINFKRNGLELPLEKRKIFIEKKKHLVLIESEFSNNLMAEKDFLLVSLKDLEGVPQSYIDGLEKAEDCNFKITLDYPHYFPFMDNAKNAEMRKALEFKFNNRGGETNKKLLEEAIQIREELALLLGYKNHAEFVLERRMAKSPETVRMFLKALADKLIIIGKKELAALSEIKKKNIQKDEPDTIFSWDWRYYHNLMKKTQFDVDTEKIREYFPIETVLTGLFEIYQNLLNVKFQEEKGAATWHPSVKKYRVEKEGKTTAYFFTDLFPREGKYGHAAAFTLISGNRRDDGTYEVPASSIVANFNAPQGDKPPLLDHSEVETLFHEFGHIMHQILTQAKYLTFAGTSVKTDFVEAPSQMLENWVWKKEALEKLSGHYKNPKQKLPEDLIQKLLSIKELNQGIHYLRQLSFATLDLDYHTVQNVDTTAIYARVMKDILLIPIQDRTLPQASFGHLMGGYDAGYYSYLWSEVYAQDMFTRFEKEGLFNPSTGQEYRKWILESGGEKEPQDLIQGFLGREPNNQAFLKSLGIN